MPAKWIGRDDKPELLPDQGTRLLAHNAGTWPESPMEPGIRAVLHLRPDYDFTTLDLISDRRQLARLFEVAVRRERRSKKHFQATTVLENSALVLKSLAEP